MGCSSGGSAVFLRSIGGLFHLEEAAGLLAEGAAGRRGLALVDIAAVPADPDGLFRAVVEGAVPDGADQTAVALFVLLFHLSGELKGRCQRGKALLPGGLGVFPVHLAPLKVLAGGGILQIAVGVRDLAAVQRRQPEGGVDLLIVRGLAEDTGDELTPLPGGLLGIDEVLDPGLALPGKGAHQIGPGAAVFQFQMDPSFAAMPR